MGDDITFPVPQESARGADLLVIERWAEQQRAELLRLLDELRQLDEHLAALEERHAAPEAPVTLLPVIDGMLDAGMARLDTATAAVHAEAARTIEIATRDAEALLRQHRVDERIIERITDPAPRIVRDLPRPRTAMQLWQDLSAGTSPAGEPTTPAPAGSPGSVPVAAPAAPALAAGAPVPPPQLLAPGAAPAAPPGPPVASAEGWLDGSTPALDDLRTWGPSHLPAHDQFWAELPPDRPVRERLRRFAQRSPQ